MNKQKIYLSSTSIRTFLSCNQKFKYQYLDKVRVPKNNSNKYLSFGRSIHLTLAEFNKLSDKSFISLNELLDLLRKNWIRDGYESLEEEKMYGEQALDILKTYYNDPKDQGLENLFIEKSISINFKDYVLKGKLDKVYVRNDNKIEIIDYKTGKSIYPLDNLQFPIYLLLVYKELGVFPDYVSYYFLNYNSKVTREVTDEIVNSLSINIHALCNSIVDNESYETNYSKYCKINCEYYHLCNILNFKNKNCLNLNFKYIN